MKQEILLTISIIIILSIPIFFIFINLSTEKNDKESMLQQTSAVQSASPTPHPTKKIWPPVDKNKVLRDVDKLIDLPNSQEANIERILDIALWGKKHEIFNRAYEGDIVIMYKEKTIIYDELINTIRDIANVTIK